MEDERSIVNLYRKLLDSDLSPKYRSYLFCSNLIYKNICNDKSSRDKLLIDLDWLTLVLNNTNKLASSLINDISNNIDDSEKTINDLYELLISTNSLLGEIKHLHLLTTELRKGIIDEDIKQWSNKSYD